MVAPFKDSREHLYAELARLDLLIRREVWRWQQTGAPERVEDELRGLFISDAEVGAILNGIYPGSEVVRRRTTGRRIERALSQAIARAADEISRRKRASAARGISLRLEELRTRFDLLPLDLDILLVCIAPELELRYERLYSYLQDDVTRKRPTVALILNLLCPDREARLAARSRFAPDAPLLRHRLLTLFGDPSQPQPPLLAHYARVEQRVLGFVLEQDALDPALDDCATLITPTLDLDALIVPPKVARRLARLADSPPKRTPAVIVLRGAEGSGRHTVAQSLCAAWRRPLLTVNLERLPADASALSSGVMIALREARLTGAVVYWQGYVSLLEEGTSPRRDQFHDLLVSAPLVHFLPLDESRPEPGRALLRAAYLTRINLPRPDYALRRRLWARFLEGHKLAPDADLSAVAGRFRLTVGQIYDAVADAAHRAEGQPITTADLFAAARDRTAGRLAGLAKKIVPRHTWDDLVLPADQVAQLHELCAQVHYRHVVLDEWGFDHRLSLGKGLNALFAGPSGTGKTMAAEVVAGELGLDLYKIDLSTVVSKYVGETEKNLERIFTAAHHSNAILFFDEADALFGKRSEVRDAHDRYANVEISYLLQKMEEYDGLVILTTNLNKNMDEAFVRRMHFTVEFPYPEPADRLRLWKVLLPPQVPLANDVDLELLATRYRLTGGNIRNVILYAAFLAARDGGRLGMEHLLWATRREFQKMGRLADEREFEMA